MRKIFSARIVAIVTCVALMVGCGPKEKNVCHVNPMNWSKSADIVYENNQPGQSYLDIAFFVRCNADFDAKMLPVVIRITAPDSSECIEPAIWMFDGELPTTPATTTQMVSYRTVCSLNQQGKYTFSIVPMQPVRGVEAVGITIEETDLFKQ